MASRVSRLAVGPWSSVLVPFVCARRGMELFSTCKWSQQAQPSQPSHFRSGTERCGWVLGSRSGHSVPRRMRIGTSGTAASDV